MDDFYKEVKILSQDLKLANYADLANDIDSCVGAGGSSGGEIVMCLRIALKKVKDEPKVQSELKQQASHLIAQINKTGW